MIAFNDFIFVPHDGSLANILGTGISASLMINSLSSTCAHGVRVLLIFDTSCHSGAIEALNGVADKMGGGVVTLRNLYDHVYSRTQQDSGQTQHPIHIGTLSNDTPLRFLA